MGKKLQSYKSSWSRYYRVDVRVKADDVRKLEAEKVAFLLSCPALIRIDFDPYTKDRGDCEISFKDLEKPKCVAVIDAIGLSRLSARGRMW